MTSRARTGKGPRPKHVPQRTCVVCREKAGKRALTRVVRLGDGTIVVDPSGKQNGRGAYLCDKPSCWGRAATGDVLGSALRATLSSDTREYLKAYAAEHHAAEAPETPGAPDAVAVGGKDEDTDG